MRWTVLTLTLLAMTMSILSCTRNSSSVSSSTRDQPQAEKVVELGSGQTTTQTPAPRTENNQLPNVAPVRVVQPSVREQLLSVRNSAQVLPEDFIIGPLSGGDLDGTEASALKTIELFFTALGNLEIAEAPIAPERRDSLERLLTYYIEREIVPLYVRVGEIYPDGDMRARANVRLYGDIGRTDGEIFLMRDGRSWFVDDFQTDLTKLTEAYKSAFEEELFEPSKYRWLELGPGF